MAVGAVGESTRTDADLKRVIFHWFVFNMEQIGYSQGDKSSERGATALGASNSITADPEIATCAHSLFGQSNVGLSNCLLCSHLTSALHTAMLYLFFAA